MQIGSRFYDSYHTKQRHLYWLYIVHLLKIVRKGLLRDWFYILLQYVAMINTLFSQHLKAKAIIITIFQVWLFLFVPSLVDIDISERSIWLESGLSKNIIFIVCWYPSLSCYFYRCFSLGLFHSNGYKVGLVIPDILFIYFF